MKCTPKFQSRNRDACHFRSNREPGHLHPTPSFNLAIEMLVISGELDTVLSTAALSFQSRNRDACHFRVAPVWHTTGLELFQSRNRDACHFRGIRTLAERKTTQCFNLAIEMLVISGNLHAIDSDMERIVSISQSRCLSFQVDTEGGV